jgi:hypothetical protein
MSEIAFGEGSRNQTFGRPAVPGQPLEGRLPVTSATTEFSIFALFFRNWTPIS